MDWQEGYKRKLAAPGEAARATGCRHGRILSYHVLPQCIAPLIVLGSIELPHAILVEASLSFLSLRDVLAPRMRGS